MNALLFAAFGIALLLSLEARPLREKFSYIFREWTVLMAAAGTLLLADAALGSFPGTAPRELTVPVLLPLAYFLTHQVKGGVLFFASLCLVAFSVPDIAEGLERAQGFVLLAGVSLAFRLALSAVRERSLFNRVPEPFFGLPVLLLSAVPLALALSLLAAYFRP